MASHLETLERLERESREAAARQSQLEEALRLGVVMREAQRAYFRDGGRDRLIASKTAERAFDEAAAALLRTPSPTPSRGQTGRACAAPGPGLFASGPGDEAKDAPRTRSRS